MAPANAIFRLAATTDRGEVAFAAPPAPAIKKEYAIDLRGATRLDDVTLEVEAAEDGPANGWFNWLGLQNAALLPRQLAQFERFDAAWEMYLKPESYEPSFTPAYGILINADELAVFRAEHDAFLARHGASPFTAAAETAARLIPEAMIHDYVNFWGDTRYCRERDHSHLLLRHGPAAAIAGLLGRDKALLRLAARYALAIAMCEHWDDGMICAFPGSNFEHRCFVQSLCTHETALILDLAGELFTDIGREYILRRIAEEGLGSINFNTWKHEYIFHCNQLAWFTPGRILGYLVLERAMPRARPYTELAYADLIESLGHTILPDGGYVEGPTYFRCVARDGGLSLYYYARGRGKPYRSVIPDVMARTADFGAAVISTDESTDVIPICDARPLMEQEGVAVMASAAARERLGRRCTANRWIGPGGCRRRCSPGSSAGRSPPRAGRCPRSSACRRWGSWPRRARWATRPSSSSSWATGPARGTPTRTKARSCWNSPATPLRSIPARATTATRSP